MGWVLGRSQIWEKFFKIWLLYPETCAKVGYYSEKNTASVAKWLRQWFVVPPFVGSSPIVRPFKSPFLIGS